jgi:hypothetical protein
MGKSVAPLRVQGCNKDPRLAGDVLDLRMRRYPAWIKSRHLGHQPAVDLADTRTSLRRSRPSWRAPCGTASRLLSSCLYFCCSYSSRPDFSIRLNNKRRVARWTSTSSTGAPRNGRKSARVSSRRPSPAMAVRSSTWDSTYRWMKVGAQVTGRHLGTVIGAEVLRHAALDHHLNHRLDDAEAVEATSGHAGHWRQPESTY